MHILKVVFYAGILWADAQQVCGSEHCMTTQRTPKDLVNKINERGKLHETIKCSLSVKITLILFSTCCFLTLVTCITTLTFPIYIQCMFSINFDFLPITMCPERRQTSVIRIIFL